MIGYAAFAWLLWMIVMFRPGSAVIHHGSYATTLLFFTAGAVGLAGWGRIGTTLMLLNVSAFALIWLQPRAGTPVLGWHLAAVLLGTASIASMFVLAKAWLMDHQRDASR